MRYIPPSGTHIYGNDQGPKRRRGQVGKVLGPGITPRTARVHWSGERWPRDARPEFIEVLQEEKQA